MTAIFDKCRQFYSDAEYARKLGWPANPRLAQALGLYPYFLPIDQSEGTEVVIDGERLIMIGSNNYLGLTTHPRVREAAAQAVKKYGTGCTGSRFLNGTLEMHLELEERLAEFVSKEKALVFSTGFQTNLGTITAVAGKDDVIICDKDDHASIVDAAFLAKAENGAEMRFFRHNNMHLLEKILAHYPHERGKLVVVDGVFSMGGDVAPLPEIVELCEKYGAALMVDEAHSLGVLGGGRGVAAEFECVEKVDLIMGTFSKSFASIGGFVAADKEIIQWIQHFGRSFMFSASLPPASVATVLAALEVIAEEPERIRRVNEIAAYMRSELRAMGYDVGDSQTPIVPVIIGDQFKTMQVWDKLFRAGVYTNAALPPAVPAHRSLLRTSFMATHTDAQMEKVLRAFRGVGEELDLLKGRKEFA